MYLWIYIYIHIYIQWKKCTCICIKNLCIYAYTCDVLCGSYRLIARQDNITGALELCRCLSSFLGDLSLNCDHFSLIWFTYKCWLSSDKLKVSLYIMRNRRAILLYIFPSTKGTIYFIIPNIKLFRLPFILLKPV